MPLDFGFPRRKSSIYLVKNMQQPLSFKVVADLGMAK